MKLKMTGTYEDMNGDAYQVYETSKQEREAILATRHYRSVANPVQSVIITTHQFDGSYPRSYEFENLLVALYWLKDNGYIGAVDFENEYAGAFIDGHKPANALEYALRNSL